MNKLNDYLKLIEVAFHKKAPSLVINRISELKLVSIYRKKKMVAGCSIIMLSKKNNLYGINYIAVEKSMRGKGYGKMLMDKVHSKFKGIFLLRTKDTEGFYKKLGYTTFAKTKTHIYMVYMNSEVKSF